MGKFKSDKTPKDSDSDHGRIGRLDEQTLSYYRRVQQTLTDGFSDENDEKDLFLKNVFNTLSEEALPVSQNQTASNIVESLLREGNLAQLISFGSAISKDWELACTDRFASHVTQTFLLRIGAELSASRSEDDQETTERGVELVVELYTFIMSNLAFHMQNTYTSHIVRVMLEVLGGTMVSEKVIRSGVARHSKGPKKFTESVSLSQMPQYSKLLKEMCKSIAGLKKLKDHLKNNLSNPVLQTMILVLKETNSKLCQRSCRQIIENTELFTAEGEEEDDTKDGRARLPELIQHEIASHFIEQLLNVVSEELLQTILEDHLKSKLLTMSVHPVGNYVLQKLIKATHTTEQFELIYNELSNHLEDILGMNHPHVIVSLAEACLKHGTRQEKLVKALLEAFHCHEPAERQIRCLQLFTSLTTYDVFYKSLTKDQHSGDEDSDDSDEEEGDKEIEFPQLTNVNYHGSLLVQQLFRFGNPKLLVTSLLQMRPAELKALACSPCGSHVIDAFLNSTSIGEKSRVSLQQKYKGMYLHLATHRHGSRILDKFFNSSPIKYKQGIAEELSKHEAKIRGDVVGRIIWFKYGLDRFLRNKDQWRQSQMGQDRKRRMLDEILGKETAAPKKKKKKKSHKRDTKAAEAEEDEEEEDHSASLRLEDSDFGSAGNSSVMSFARSRGKDVAELSGKHRKESWKHSKKDQGHKSKKLQIDHGDRRMNIIKDPGMKDLLQELGPVGGKTHSKNSKKSKKR